MAVLTMEDLLMQKIDDKIMMIIIIKASTDYLRCSMSVRYIYIVRCDLLAAKVMD